MPFFVLILEFVELSVLERVREELREEGRDEEKLSTLVKLFDKYYETESALLSLPRMEGKLSVLVNSEGDK